MVVVVITTNNIFAARAPLIDPSLMLSGSSINKKRLKNENGAGYFAFQNDKEEEGFFLPQYKGNLVHA